MSAALIALVGLFLYFGSRNANSNSVLMGKPALWSARARRSWAALYAAYAFLIFSVIAGIAGAASPFFSYALLSGSYSISAYFTSFKSCISFSGGGGSTGALCAAYFELRATLGGALVIFGLSAFSFPATVITGVASVRVRRVFSADTMPPVGRCKTASLPAATALSWVGFIVECVGGALLWSFYDPLNQLISMTGGYMKGGFSSGSGLLAASIVAHFVANVLLSSAGCCCVGNLPGIGRARRNCCCAEADANAVPIEAAVHSLPAPTTETTAGGQKSNV